MSSEQNIDSKITLGLVGRKVGMTRIFLNDGQTVPVTVLDVSGNKITQVKTQEIDGYSGVQIGFGKRKQNRTNKSLAGHFSKAGVESMSILKEFRVADDTSNPDLLKEGQSVPPSVFQEGQLVDITGVTKGKGFQGAIKRHGFSSQRTTHGNSISHRAPGSIGMCQDPGRVFKGKRMAGHMGSQRVTTQNLTLVRIDEEKELLLVKGAVPGSKGKEVVVKSAVRATNNKSL